MTVDPLFLSFQEAVAGRYSLERELGRGGMGVVYLAREVRLDRSVAIKLLPPSKTADPKLRERFLREARTAAKLSHPNIIPIHAVEEIGEFVFFAMAYVDGETLTERVRRRGPMAPSEAARVLRDVAWALAYAHGQGVIHRDVKPDNILLEQATGRVLVADFGIAGVVAGAGGLVAGEVVGTPEFMSPEQALGEAVDARSDLYSLGVVGYFVLSGALPFEAEKATEVLAKQITVPAPRLAAAASSAPRKLVRAIEGCLAKDAADRPQSGSELADSFGLEQRRDVPVPLRVFVKKSRGLGLGVALAYGYALLLGGVWMGTFVGAGAALGVLAGGLVLGPALYLGWQARRIVRLGYGREDVDFAFQVELERDREERAFEYGSRASTFDRVGGAVALCGTTFGIVGISVGGPLVGPAAGISLSIGLLAGLIVVFRLQRRRHLVGEGWHKFWKGRIGAWFLHQAERFGGRVAFAASGTHRATELVLGMAADKLYADLPKETQHQLRDLPDVVRRLEDDAQRMRRRMDELQDALGDAGDEGRGKGEGTPSPQDRIVADLRAERELVQRRLKDAVAALETIRLNLLRLHAGTATVKHLTTDLGLARQVAREMDLLLESQREVEELL